ncbi:hypothetical protein H4S14_004228 [Agrobacterium vitis]|nr:hypothetical protein [Agrobacterium vitis]MBE1440449.1 hypothetical protein [Agrobacterium vitis]
MRNKDDAPIECQERRFQARSIFTVNAIGWFIQQQHIRLHGKKASQTNEPLLPAREAMGKALTQMAYAQPVKRYLSDIPGSGLCHTRVQRAKSHILDHARTEKLIIAVLEEKTNPGTLGTKLLFPAANVTEKVDLS